VTVTPLKQSMAKFGTRLSCVSSSRFSEASESLQHLRQLYPDCKWRIETINEEN
jgi:hypothetical protein